MKRFLGLAIILLFPVSVLGVTIGKVRFLPVYPDEYQYGQDVAGTAVDDSGNVYILGRHIFRPEEGQNYSWYLSKYDDSGKPLWGRQYEEDLGVVLGGVLNVRRPIAVDTQGNVFLLCLDFTRDRGPDALVIKLDSDGNVIWRFSFGGSEYEYVRTLAVGEDGSVLVTGFSGSQDFPVSRDAYSSDPNQWFVAKIASEGGALEFATFIPHAEIGAIAADGEGYVYLTGYTNSPDYPTTPGAYEIQYAEGDNTFLAKLNETGSELIYSTFLPGFGGEILKIAENGVVWVAGEIDARVPERTVDVFLVQVFSNGSRLGIGARFGGTSTESVSAIEIAPDGRVYIAGNTRSRDFPQINPIPHNVMTDFQSGFLVVIGATGGVETATYVGGNGGNAGDSILGVESGSRGRIIITGNTSSRKFLNRHRASDSPQNGYIAWLKPDPSTKNLEFDDSSAIREGIRVGYW